MIHHVSISARDPKHVATVLAEVMGGKCYPFPGGIADSFMAVAGDDKGTMIEVYPEAVTLQPGDAENQVKAGTLSEPAGYVPFHILLSVPHSEATLLEIGKREGWHTQKFGRAAPGKPPFFHVIEFWIENRIMLELATPEMVADYAALIRPDRLDAMFAARAAA